jgi:hypothetical protein
MVSLAFLKGRGRLLSSISGGIVDAGFGSLGTFAVGVYAARYLEPSSLGAYALFFSVYTLLVVFASEGVLVPAEARAVSRPVPARRHVSRQAVPLAAVTGLLFAPAVVVAALLVPDSVPSSVTTPLAITTAAAVIVAPLQEHVRRVAHLSDISWRGTATSLVQFTMIIGSLVVMSLLDVATPWVPFGALAISTVVSLCFGLVLNARGGTGELGMRLQPLDLIRSGKWLVTAAFARSGSMFAASVLIAHLASPEALGYAEAARIIGRPVLVLAMGLEAVLGPRSVQAGANLDAARARRISWGFFGILLVVAVPYLLILGWDWPWNPAVAVIPTAYVIAWLVPVQITADALGGAIVPYRMELIGARREVGLVPPEALGGGFQAAMGATSGVTGAFARPLGAVALRLTQIVGYRRSLQRIYRGSSRASETPAEYAGESR